MKAMFAVTAFAAATSACTAATVSGGIAAPSAGLRWAARMDLFVIVDEDALKRTVAAFSSRLKVLSRRLSTALGRAAKGRA